MKKNLILMKRNLISTIFEIFFPVIMFSLMIMLRHIFPVEYYTFEGLDKNISHFMENRSILTSVGIIDTDKGIQFKNESFSEVYEIIYKILDLEDYNVNNFNFTNFNFNATKNLSYAIEEIILNMTSSGNISIEDNALTYLGAKIFMPPFYICSSLNLQNEERPFIASIGIPDIMKFRMYVDAEIFNTLSRMFNQSYKYEINNKTFLEFKDIETMEKYIKDPTYINHPEKSICFGLRFDYENTTNHYDYSLHFFDNDKIGDVGIQDIPKGNLFDKFQNGPDMFSFMIYQQGTYNYMMKVVNEYILRNETKDNHASFSYGIFAMKYTDYKLDIYGQYFGYILVIIIIIAYMIPLILYVYRIVQEKEAKTKEGMKIMGLGEGEYFLSYFIQFTIISLFISIINSFLLFEVFKNIPWIYLYLTVFLFSLDIFALIYFFQSFMDKTRICIVLSVIIYFIMYCISLSCMLDETSFEIKAILSIFPAVGLNLGLLQLSKFGYKFKHFYNRDLFIYHTNYSIFFMYMSFIFDFLFYIFLGFYLQNVLPHDFGIRKPWYFLCTLSYWGKGRKKKYITIEEKKELPEFNTRDSLALEDEKKEHLKKAKFKKVRTKAYKLYGDLTKFENDDIYDDKGMDECFEIRDIVKEFGDGKVAVNKVSINFYKDEIFALLGHNGAGKTTLISMLTGMYEATKGKALYCGDNVLESDNMDKFRRKLGICPQHDTLFEDLNIREHLEIFSIFKGVNSARVNDEINRTLRDFQIENIQYMLARNLSAGQRRKLSIAISLIGGSEIIFLDEPSSGMDITSRRNLWEILKRQCNGKIIILTTHYMEEASVLGKRIGIINAGQMKCIGSPLFLINRYGKYMSLNVMKEEDADNNAIVNFVTSLANNIEYEILSEEIMFRVPIKGENDENIKIDIPKFFQAFDENLNNVKIKSYSVAMPTLEDVFLNVGAEDNKKTKEEKKQENLREEENDNLLFNTDLLENYTWSSKFKNDFSICMKKRYLVTKRDIKGFLMEILCPIFLVLFGLILSKFQMDEISGPSLVNLDITGNQKIIFSSMDGKGYDEYLENRANVEFVTIDTNLTQIKDDRTAIAQYFIEKAYEISKDSESYENHAVDMEAEDYVGYYSSILMFSDFNSRYEFMMALNTRVRHSIPIYSYYVLSSIIQKECQKRNKSISITFTHYPMPLTEDLKEQKAIGNYLAIIFFIAIAFAIMPANFITLLVKERINNSKHLMRVSGINIISYWLVNYIFEFIKYYFTAGVCILLLYLFNFYRPYFYILYLIYGPAMVSSTYAMSFFFENESKAQNAIIIINFILGDLGSIILIMLRFMDSVKEIAKIIQHILSLTPTFCFDFSFNILLNKVLIFMADFKGEDWNKQGDELMIKDMRLLLPLILFCSGECIVYTIIFIIIESRTYSFKKSTHVSIESGAIDFNVQKEVERVNKLGDELLPYDMKDEDEDIVSINPRPLTRYENVAVSVRNLRKQYRNGCITRRKNTAVNNLNFAIEPGECFGLLGLNGAGKTTTFKCITQEIAPDNGEIYVFGKEIRGKFNELKKIFGYCPQFDAIFEYLTVYENLEFYARIKGIKRNLVHQLVTSMIEEMSLSEFTNKISGRMSGGNKRKLSVAISMIGNPPIILLDEPSTGMDPEARRFMWSVIHKMSTKGKKSSVIMTTHSMDEAETLCRRMGIMVNGEFVCMGTANEIKEKYGYGYEADIRIKPMSHQKQIEILDKAELDLNEKVNNKNIKNILEKLGKANYYEELKQGRLGERIHKTMSINGNINIGILLNWLFFVENALKFIKAGKQYFSEIILSEHIENNFLFRLKKGNEAKSIGFFFGLFDGSKEECNITEYTIQQTSLEQIFNKFASSQGIINNNINIDDDINEKKGIYIDDELLTNLNI